LLSKRIENGLEARISVPAKYCAFPGEQPAACHGVLLGGVASFLFSATLACFLLPWQRLLVAVTEASAAAVVQGGYCVLYSWCTTVSVF
jgi:hypothetical protein